MEVVSYKVLQSYYCIWSEDDSFLVEDVEAQRILALSEAQLRWFLEALSELLRGPEDCFFQKHGELDRGTKVVEVLSKKWMGAMLANVKWALKHLNVLRR